MNRFFLVILLLQCIAYSYAQPSRDWATYFGINYTVVSAVQYDDVCDCIYVVGKTYDTLGIGTVGTHSPDKPSVFGDWDAFIIKVDMDGNKVWGTYFGGEGVESNLMVNTDHSGNIYLTGESRSTDIATSGAFIEDGSPYGGYFVAKFNGEGILNWATYYGVDPAIDIVTGGNNLTVDFDLENNMYLSGATVLDNGIGTATTHMPEPPVPDSLIIDDVFLLVYGVNGFLAKFDSNGARLWGTYFGGEHNDYIKKNYYSSDGYIYIVGFTSSDTEIATSGVYQEAKVMDVPNMPAGFLAKFTTSGTLVWSTYISGDHSVSIENITGDAFGNIYLYGSTMSDSYISTAGAYLEDRPGGHYNLFVMKFSPSGEKMWGTYLGGESGEINTQSVLHEYPYSIVSSENDGAVYLCAEQWEHTDFATSCTYRSSQGKYGIMAKLSHQGDMQWVSHYDALVGDIAVKSYASAAADIFLVSNTTFNGMATPGAFIETKPLLSNAGVIARFKDFYNCNQDTLSISYSDNALTVDTGFETYKWYRNGDLLGDNDEALIISDTTSEYVVITEKCGCVYSDTFNFATMRIEGHSSAYGIDIAPNPVEDLLQIHNRQQISIRTIKIIDFIGKVVYESNIGNASKFIQIPVAFLQKGTYILQLESAEGPLLAKIVKQ